MELLLVSPHSYIPTSPRGPSTQQALWKSSLNEY